VFTPESVGIMNESRELKAPRWLRTISQIELKKKKKKKKEQNNGKLVPVAEDATTGAPHIKFL
jgi:hypothetical protein